jgi:hypothetical protein
MLAFDDRADKDKSSWLEHPVNFLYQSPVIEYMLNEHGADYHVKDVIFQGKQGAVSLDNRGINVLTALLAADR